MAERRMFSKTIMDSDTFMDMPVSTQMLYVHLSMRADDDGFVGNPKRIQKMTDCGEDELNELIDRNFIIPFQSGVIAITHWKIHNQIKKDRYRETVYLKEKALLHETETKTYKLKNEDGKTDAIGAESDTDRNPSGTTADTDRNPSGTKADTSWNPSGAKTEPQYSIGKVSIGKVSSGKVSSDQFSSVEVSSVPSSTEAIALKDKKEETEEEEEGTNNQKERETERPLTVLPLKDGKEYPIFQKHVSTWSFMYPLVDVEKEFVGMQTFLDEHPEERITAASMNVFMMNWLRDKQEKRKSGKG